MLNFGDWFGTYDHWLLKGFWAALVVTTCFELVFLAAILRHGREETAPGLGPHAWALFCGAAVLAAATGWSLLKASIDDPLYLITFLLTITWCLPSITALFLRRGMRRGMSVRQLGAYCGMALGYVLLTIVVFELRSPWWLAVCGLTMAWGVGMLIAVARAPAWMPESESRSPEAGRPLVVAAR